MRINIQPIEKRVYRSNYALEVHSIFYTIQGEGPLTGHPAIFIRLAGCNLQCPYCDTEYSNHRTLMTSEKILIEVMNLQLSPRLVVITGGEPFRQDITYLCNLLINENYEVQIETNGTLPLPPHFPVGDYHTQGAMIVCSPKTGKVHESIAASAIAFKYVLMFNQVDLEDGLPLTALNHSAHPKLARPHLSRIGFPVGAVYLQPADVQDETMNKLNREAVLSSAMKYGYTVQLQTHKLLGVD